MSYATNSNGGYSGTIVASPIRPSGPSQSIATVYSNEIKGGHHNYETLNERDTLIENRRDWGMLVSVYNDGTSSNNQTYQLKYGWSNTIITDNNNWVSYTTSGSSNQSTNQEWIDSVISIEITPPTYNNGDRYLVGTGGTGLYNTHDGEIATYDVSINGGLGGWVFTTPTNGTTLRVDSENNTIYKFEGVWNNPLTTGSWVKEYLNQIRYILPSSVDGLFYTYSSSSQDRVDSYSYSIYYAKFGMTNSGTVSLSIDGLSTIEVRKVTNNVLVSMSSGDIVPSVEYQLILNDTYLQTSLPTSTNVIGAAEEGDYTDGLYTDFTINTPIGTAVDRFNEVLKALVPPSAPDLSSWSATGSFVGGKLSFDSSNSVLISATQSPYGSVAKGETFSASSYRLGIMSKSTQPLTANTFYQDITGVLNIGVSQHTSTPTPSYATYSFGNATSGTVSLLFNGVTISSVGLSIATASYDTTTSGATSGLIISAATSSKFASGFPFETFMNRTGSYRIKRDSSNMLDGYNYFIVKHDLPTTSYTLSRYEFVADSNTASTTFTNPSIGNKYTSTNKYLSGIQYFNTYGLKYVVQIDNLYGNTFNLSNSAITFADPSSATANGVYTGPSGVSVNTVSTYPIFTPYLSSIPIPSVLASPTQNWVTPGNGWSYSTNNNVRRINNNLSFNTTVLRTVQGTVIGGTAIGTVYPVTNWFIDTYNSSSTNLVENFDDENYRLLNFGDKYNNTSYNLSPISIPTYGWSSSLSLISDASHKNGLQVINGHLIYPKFDFSSVGTADTNPNFSIGSSVQYNNCSAVASPIGHGTASGITSQYRTYTRYFNVGTALNYPALTLKLTHTGCTPINSNLPLTNNSNIWVEFKLPYSSGTPTGGTAWGYGGSTSLTGWLDATKPFVSSPVNYADGAGCLSGSIPSSGGNWSINFGLQGTIWSGGWVLMRITAGPNWTGYIDKIEISVS
jgi:hypothetical protein